MRRRVLCVFCDVAKKVNNKTKNVHQFKKRQVIFYNRIQEMDTTNLQSDSELKSVGARVKLVATVSDLKEKMGNYGWIRLIVAVWASRMALAAVSYALPAIVAVYQEINARFIEEKRPLQYADWDLSGNAFYSAGDENFPKVSVYKPHLVSF